MVNIDKMFEEHLATVEQEKLNIAEEKKQYQNGRAELLVELEKMAKKTKNKIDLASYPLFVRINNRIYPTAATTIEVYFNKEENLYIIERMECNEKYAWQIIITFMLGEQTSGLVYKDLIKKLLNEGRIHKTNKRFI